MSALHLSKGGFGVLQHCTAGLVCALLASAFGIACNTINLKKMFRFYTQFDSQCICILVHDHSGYSTGTVTVSQQSPYLSIEEDLSALH